MCFCETHSLKMKLSQNFFVFLIFLYFFVFSYKMVVGKKNSPQTVLENVYAEGPTDKPFGIVIPLDNSTMILKSPKFSIMKSYPDLKSADPTFTLRITPEEKDVAVLEKILKKIVGFAMKEKASVAALAKDAVSEDPEVDFKSAAKYDENSFKLIRENGDIWARLYHEPVEMKIYSDFWRLQGQKRQLIKDPKVLIGSEMSGRINLNLKQIFLAKHKAITCVALEVLVEDERKPVSAFDEFSEEEEN